MIVDMMMCNLFPFFSLNFLGPFTCYLYLADMCQESPSHVSLFLVVNFSFVGCNDAICQLLTARHCHFDQLIPKTATDFQKFHSHDHVSS